MLEFTKEKPFNLYQGDSYEILKQLPNNSIDSIVTDPPYGLSKQPDLNDVLKHWLNDEIYKSPSKGFMGKDWDSFVPSPLLWKEVFRVLKPGGYILAFAGTRTQHLMAIGLGLAGFDIKDVIFWTYGSGFPKSHSVEKNINKKFGVEFEKSQVEGVGFRSDKSEKHRGGGFRDDKNWYKQKGESCDLAKKWSGWGTGLKPALEPITLARKPMSEKNTAENVLKHGTGALNIDGCRIENETENKGRFPTNFIVEENDLNLSILEEKSKYFYHPKCNKTDRNEGLDDLKNIHPTVKPTDLMSYLCRLITPPNGIVLDPFNGSGSTGKAAMREGFNYIGIDLDKDYIDISKARILFELNKETK